MIVLSLVVVGAAGFFRLGVDRFPSVDLPTVSVRVSLRGAAPDVVESLVAQRIEVVGLTGEGVGGSLTDSIYFTAGPEDEAEGLYGVIEPCR